MLLRGVVFRVTVRGGHASVAVIVTGGDGDDDCKGVDGERPPSSDDAPSGGAERMVLVVLRLGGAEWDANSKGGQEKEILTQLRSNIRRICKLGNEVEFRGHFDDPPTHGVANASETSRPSTDWTTWERFIVDYYLPTSSPIERDNVRICQELKWTAAQCQARRDLYFASRPQKQQPKKKAAKAAQRSKDDGEQSSNARHHGGGIGKRRQGEIVADFLLWMLLALHCDGNYAAATDDDDAAAGTETGAPVVAQPSPDPDKQVPTAEEHLFTERWVPFHPYLASSEEVATRNAFMARKIEQSQTADTDGQGDNTAAVGGIIDAAGGAGHVSLALALRGVHSTVVDPRVTVGRLPGRDRKALKKSKKPPFSIFRAWFGTRPEGVDSVFREGASNEAKGQPGDSDTDDPTTLPICSMCSEDRLLLNCAAIVALHPDEATGSIVETAVQNKIPFVVVPCCVFSRLFPERSKPNGAIVSTYYELLDWLVAKHPAIRVTRVTRLPFEGANIAVWATFR